MPAPSTLTLSGVDPRLVVARSYEYSLGVQRELPAAMLLQVSYVGNLGRHILRTPSINNATWTQPGFIPVSPDPNTLACPSGINAAAFQCAGGFAPGLSKDRIRPYLGYSSLNLALGDVDSNYNSLQVSLTKRAGFITATFAYTYSKAMAVARVTRITKIPSPNARSLASSAQSPIRSWSTVQRLRWQGERKRAGWWKPGSSLTMAN